MTRKIVITVCFLLVGALALFGCSKRESQTSKSKNSDTQTATTANQQTASTGETEATTQGGPSIHFVEDAIDFGTIQQGERVSHTFVFKNTGDAPLKIIRAKGS